MRIVVQILILVAIWIGLSVVGNVIGRLVFETTWLEHMTKNVRGVSATVTGKEPENHARILYTYSANGTQYEGSGGAGDDNPEFEDIQIGDQIVIYYDADNPSKSIAGNPWYDLDRNYSVRYGVMLTFPIFPMMFILIIYFAVRAARKKPAPTAAQ